VIKELKVIRHRGVWQVVMTVESEQRREYPATGLSCGIDPGITTPCTLAGEDMPLGVGGIEYGPGLTPGAAKKLRRQRRKLRRLQRKLDRQRRANNPQCYGFDGVWIKGARITVVSNGMRETEDRIAAAHAHWAALRKNIWSEAANEILTRYDTVYFGNWKDSTPKKKGEARRRRRKAFAKNGEKRPKGEAKRQRTVNRKNRDNGLGGFRQVLAERAAASVTPKQVIVTREPGTTRCCARCGAAAGPAGRKSLGRRVWTCPECKFRQKRDCSAAWNILQVGKRQLAGGQPGMGGRNPSVAGGSQVLPTPGKGSVPGIEQTIASGQVVSSSREALARAQPTVSRRGSNTRLGGPGPLRRPGPPPLAKGTVNPGKDST
jgi:hypothetical protein